MSRAPIFDPALEQEWGRLRVQLDFSAGFWLGFSFLTSVTSAQFLEKRTELFLHEHTRSLYLIEATHPANFGTALTELMTEPVNAGCTWIRSINIDNEIWHSAAWNFFARLNERRDALRRRVDGGLVFALHPSMKALVRDAAPDLWSVRSLVLEPSSLRRPPIPRSDVRRPINDEEDESADILVATPISFAPMRDLLRRASALLLAGQAAEAVAVAHEALASAPPGLPDSDMAAALTWTSRAEEAAGDDAAAAEHTDRALPLLSKGDRLLRKELLDRTARLAGQRREFNAVAVTRQMLLELARNDAAENPDSVVVIRELGRAVSRLGDVQSDLGDIQAALASHTEALQLARRLAEADPTRDALSDLSLRLDKVGITRHTLGDLQGALASYTEALRLDRHLAEDYEQVPGILRDLAVSVGRVGDVQRDLGDLQGALVSYTEALQLARNLAEIDDSSDSLGLLSFRTDALGNIQRDLADLQGALASYTEALQLSRRLAEADDSPFILRNHAVSIGKVGDIQRDLEDLEAALASCTESLRLFRRLAEAYGETPDTLRDLSVGLVRAGDVRDDLGDPQGALASYTEALQLARRLTEDYDQIPETLRELSVALDGIGSIEYTLGNLEAALASFTEALQLDRRLAEDYDQTPSALRNLSATLAKLGDVQHDLGDLHDAEASFTEARQLEQATGIVDESDGQIE